MKNFPLEPSHYTPGAMNWFLENVKPIQAMFGRLLLVTEPIGKTQRGVPIVMEAGLIKE